MDDHRRNGALEQGETLEQGLGSPPSASRLGGGAELATVALEVNRICRWTGSLLGPLTTITLLLAYAAHTGT